MGKFVEFHDFDNFRIAKYLIVSLAKEWKEDEKDPEIMHPVLIINAGVDDSIKTMSIKNKYLYYKTEEDRDEDFDDVFALINQDEFEEDNEKY